MFSQTEVCVEAQSTQRKGLLQIDCCIPPRQEHDVVGMPIVEAVTSAKTRPHHSSLMAMPFQHPVASAHLQDDAPLDEVIKSNLPPSLPVKLADEDVVELVREPIALKRRPVSVVGWGRWRETTANPLRATQPSGKTQRPALSTPCKEHHGRAVLETHQSPV